MANRYTFDTAYLHALAEQRIGTEGLTLKLGICRERLELLLSGKSEFTYSEMLAFARILNLTNKEFERCFFMLESSENLN